MTTALALSALVAVSAVVPAVALLVRGRARAAAAALLASAAGLVTATLAGGEVSQRVGLLTGLLLAPLVVLAYPRLRTRHAVDFLALVAVVGAGTLGTTLPVTADTMGFVVLLVLVGHVWWSLERATGTERRAVTWLALAGASATLGAGLLSFALADAEGTSVWAVLPFVVVGPALYVGVGRPDLADARLLVVEVVAHTTTLVTVLGLFVGIAAPLVGAGLDSTALATLGLLSAALAAAYAPTQRVLRATVAEVVTGARPDPLAAVGMVTRTLGEEPAEALDAVRQALALPWAALLADPPLGSGTRPESTVRIPLGADLPDLEVGLRDGDARLSRTDERVLSLAAPLLGQSLRLHALAAQVQASRAQSVLALEDERLRLRRDLHDGLGPLLSGLAFTTDAARNLLRADPEGASALLTDVRQQAETALEDVRRLVYAMRPPALDELGLQRAVQQATRDLPLEVRVDAPADLVLPAAVEVAAYRILVEAVQNAARHGSAGRVVVRVTDEDSQLRLEVDDDGGPAAPWSRGVGLSSMHERAAEVGGWLEAGPEAWGGRVRAGLPLSAPRSSSTAG